MPARWLALLDSVVFDVCVLAYQPESNWPQSDYGTADGCTGIWVVLAGLVANGYVSKTRRSGEVRPGYRCSISYCAACL